MVSFQCTGEAEYADDVASSPRELFAAYVVTTVGNCDITDIDWSVAMVIEQLFFLFT